ncbi:hypothetical protein [Anthocerotibacter panamensis]|uniref:hypothetical protein n=1 Tax=Anthocerotibacter panamensis TaxID=2857077 RepID=UPI001C4049C4|nr:hypothetical protein [Anthocerotibacter panamensis]
MAYVTVKKVAESRKQQGLRAATRQGVLYRMHRQGLIASCLNEGGMYLIPEDLAREKLGYIPVNSQNFD